MFEDSVLIVSFSIHLSHRTNHSCKFAFNSRSIDINYLYIAKTHQVPD